MIPLNEVTVVGADATVLSWPVKARLESIGIVPNRMHIRCSGAEHWRAIDIDSSRDSSGDGNPSNDSDQGGTLWVFEHIGGKWYASGAERLRPTQINGDKPVADPAQGGLTTLIGNGWLYDANRWGPMAGFNPRAGDIVGFMITSGSTRIDSVSRERERTDIVACRWPDATGRMPFEEVWREGAPVIQPEVPPAAPQVVTPPSPAAGDAWRGECDRLSQLVNGLVAEIARQRERIDALEGANTATNVRIDHSEGRTDELSAKVAAQQAALDNIAAPRSAHVNVFGTRIPVAFE